MISLTITDEMLESARIEESDKENLKKARHKDFINVEGTISQAFIRELSFNGLNYLFKQVYLQAHDKGYKLTLANSLVILHNKLESMKTFRTEEGMLVAPGEFLNGFKAAIEELNEVYLKSLN